jgi:hypothetical protein
MNIKILIGILILVIVALILFYKAPVTPPVTTTTVPQVTTTIVHPVTTTVPTVSAENQAYNVIDQELGSATQNISNSDVQNAMTS